MWCFAFEWHLRYTCSGCKRKKTWHFNTRKKKITTSIKTPTVKIKILSPAKCQIVKSLKSYVSFSHRSIRTLPRMERPSGPAFLVNVFSFFATRNGGHGFVTYSHQFSKWPVFKTSTISETLWGLDALSWKAFNVRDITQWIRIAIILCQSRKAFMSEIAIERVVHSPSQCFSHFWDGSVNVFLNRSKIF